MRIPGRESWGGRGQVQHSAKSKTGMVTIMGKSQNSNQKGGGEAV